MWAWWASSCLHLRTSQKPLCWYTNMCTHVLYIVYIYRTCLACCQYVFIRWQTWLCWPHRFCGHKSSNSTSYCCNCQTRVEWNMKWSSYHSNTTQYMVNTVARTYLFCIIPRQQYILCGHAHHHRVFSNKAFVLVQQMVKIEYGIPIRCHGY